MLINGQEYTYCDLKISFLGNKNVAGCSSITYKKAKAHGNSKGTGADPTGYIKGGNTYTGSIRLSMKEIKAIRKAIGTDLTECPPFTMQITYSNELEKDSIDSLFFVRFNEDGGGGSGDNTLEVDIPLTIGGARLT